MIWLLACTEEPEPTTPTDTEPPAETTGDTGLEPEPTADTGAEPEPEPSEIWTRFLEERDGFLLDLSVPILSCVEQQDTSHPVFHGCIDWHSSVHGTWALLALYRLTGDPLYLDAADAVLDPEGLEQELLQMQDGSIGAEIPYGFSWFLLLSRERELSSGDQDLRALADEAELQLAEFVDGLQGMEVRNQALSGEYDNLSWAVLQLWEQAVWNGDAAQQAHWEEYARTKLVPLDPLCPLEDDAQNTGFFPPCLHRAHALLRVLPPDEALAWSEGFLPATLALTPRTQFQTIHQAGQNFSRSWGLWTIWATAADEVWLDLYASHVGTHMVRPEFWAENYLFYSHWIAQFGVYGIALSYE